MASLALGLLLLAGCATDPQSKYTTVMEGMSRNNLRFYFGEPTRIVQTPRGEDWYYRFAFWHAAPTSDSGTTIDPATGERSNYASVILDISKDSVEMPVHVSPDGFVVRPVPEGKIIKN